MERFSFYIQKDGCNFKYARGESSRVGKEFHSYHEIIYFMGERALLFSETGKTQILPGNLILIPAHTYHSLQILGNPTAYHRCLFHFSVGEEWAPLASECMRSLRVISETDRVGELIRQLADLSQEPASDAKAKMMLQAVLAMLLYELPKDPKTPMTPIDPLVQKTLEKISVDLCKELSVEGLARNLNVSSSTLSHTFRKELHISVYRYIQKKRLAMAAQRLELGELAATVCAECGFRDYSNFYRQYKKEYGCSPSEKSRVK